MSKKEKNPWYLLGIDDLMLYGPAPVADWALGHCAYVTDNHAFNKSDLEYRTGGAMSASRYSFTSVWFVNSDGDRLVNHDGNRTLALRAALPFSEIDPIDPNGERVTDELTEYVDRSRTYARKIADKETSDKVKWAVDDGVVNVVGNYTTDSKKHDDYCESFVGISNPVYEIDGKYYAVSNANLCEKKQTFSNGQEVSQGEPVVYEIELMRFLVHKDRPNVAVSTFGIASGVRYLDKETFLDSLNADTKLIKIEPSVLTEAKPVNTTIQVFQKLVDLQTEVISHQVAIQSSQEEMGTLIDGLGSKEDVTAVRNMLNQIKPLLEKDAGLKPAERGRS